MPSTRGAGWMGWALYLGVPSTLAALSAAWPLGLVLGAVTLAAFLIGRHMDAADTIAAELRKAPRDG